VYSEGLWPAAALFSAASNISRAFSRNWLTRLYRAVLEKFERERRGGNGPCIFSGLSLYSN
jgi:hypothetical protein